MGSGLIPSGRMSLGQFRGEKLWDSPISRFERAENCHYMVFLSPTFEISHRSLGNRMTLILTEIKNRPEKANTKSLGLAVPVFISQVFQAGSVIVFDKILVPLRFWKAGRVWGGGARETKWATCHNKVTPSKTKEFLKSPRFFRS